MNSTAKMKLLLVATGEPPDLWSSYFSVKFGKT